MTDPTDSTYLFEARRLAAQYHWRLIPTDAWAAAAQQTQIFDAFGRCADEAALGVHV